MGRTRYRWSWCRDEPIPTAEPTLLIQFFACALAWAADPAAIEALFQEAVSLQVDRSDHAGAASRYDEACGLGHQPSCSNLASQLERGLGVPRDLPRAASMHRAACTAGMALSCDALGTLAANGVGVPQDDVAALALYQRSCDLGSGPGCGHLAIMLDGGFGAERNWDAAHAAYGRACELGDGASCLALGRKLVGLRRPDVADEAAGTLAKGCEVGERDACGLLATELQTGTFLLRDPKRAREMAERACALGHPDCAGKP